MPPAVLLKQSPCALDQLPPESRGCFGSVVALHGGGCDGAQAQGVHDGIVQGAVNPQAGLPGQDLDRQRVDVGVVRPGMGGDEQRVERRRLDREGCRGD